jgi:hypothetical protein
MVGVVALGSLFLRHGTQSYTERFVYVNVVDGKDERASNFIVGALT